MVKKVVKRKRAGAGTGVLAKQRRQMKWRNCLTFLHRNTSICTQRYMQFEAEYWNDFKNSLSGHETCIRDIALIVNRAKYNALPPKPVPMTLNEWKKQQPKKLTKKQRIKEAKTPSMKPLPKPTLETVFEKNEQTVPLEQYLDIIERLSALSKIAADFNKQIDKFPDDCQGNGDAPTEQLPGILGQDGMAGSATVTDLINNGDKMCAYWKGLSGAKTFKILDCGSVDFAIPALLTQEQEADILKEKWKHLARTILRLAQTFIQYATKKTGIIINDSENATQFMKQGLTSTQVDILDRLSKTILITPVTEKTLNQTENLLSAFSLSNIGKPKASALNNIGQPPAPKEEPLPGQSDAGTLILPDDPPKVGGVKKKKKGGKKKYSINSRK